MSSQGTIDRLRKEIAQRDDLIRELVDSVKSLQAETMAKSLDAKVDKKAPGALDIAIRNHTTLGQPTGGDDAMTKSVAASLSARAEARKEQS